MTGIQAITSIAWNTDCRLSRRAKHVRGARRCVAQWRLMPPRSAAAAEQLYLHLQLDLILASWTVIYRHE